MIAQMQYRITMPTVVVFCIGESEETSRDIQWQSPGAVMNCCTETEWFFSCMLTCGDLYGWGADSAQHDTDTFHRVNIVFYSFSFWPSFWGFIIFPIVLSNRGHGEALGSHISLKTSRPRGFLNMQPTNRATFYIWIPEATYLLWTCQAVGHFCIQKKRINNRHWLILVENNTSNHLFAWLIHV